MCCRATGHAARLGAEALDVGREYVSLRLDHWHEALDGCHGVGISARRLLLTLKSYLELGLERDELRYGTEQCLSPQIYRHVGSSFPVCLVTMRWPVHSAYNVDHPRDQPAEPTHGGTDHARAYTHRPGRAQRDLSLIHISEPTRLGMISYAVFCLKKKKKTKIRKHETTHKHI